jgi:hypothetical protein
MDVNRWLKQYLGRVIWSVLGAAKADGLIKTSRCDGKRGKKLWIRGRSQQTLSNDGYNSPILSAMKDGRKPSMKTLSGTLALYISG